MSVQSISLAVPKIKKKRWGKPKPGESLKMLAAGSLAFAKAYSSVEKLEHELEAEIQRDKQSEPEQGVARWRSKGGKMLLNKYVLLFIVALNTIDCALVLGELILDLHHVKDILTKSEETTGSFLEQLRDKYPHQFMNLGQYEIEEAYRRIISAKMTWIESNNSSDTFLFQSGSTAVVEGENGTIQVFSSLSGTASKHNVHASNLKTQNVNSGQKSETTKNESEHSSFKRDISDTTLHTNSTGGVLTSAGTEEEQQSFEEVIGHAFHKASMCICIILVIWVSLKVICFGRAFLDRKLEVFDAVIIMLSFIVDLIFIEGLSKYTIQEFVFILAFMLPWRVIRVTNSLVVTVRDHEHFRLKLLYTQKKKVEGENKQIRLDRDNYREQVDALKKLCLNEGVDDWKIFQSLAKQQIHPGKGAMGSFASLAFGAIGNAKSSSIWSVLATPKMRRGKSMESVDNQRVTRENHYAKKRHSKSRVLSFLGSSTDFFKGKISKNEQNLSIDSDPGISYAINKCNSHNTVSGKKLVRGETIDTISTDTSFEGGCGTSDMKLSSCGDDNGDLSRQDTVDSSVFDECSNSSQCSDGKVTMLRTSNNDHCNHVIHYTIEESPIIRRPASVPITTLLQVPNSTNSIDQSE